MSYMPCCISFQNTVSSKGELNVVWELWSQLIRRRKKDNVVTKYVSDFYYFQTLCCIH